MRKTLLLLFVVFIGVVAVALEPEDQVVVQVRTAWVRQVPGPLGKPIGEVNYEAVGVILEVRADWVRVTFDQPRVEGWLHTSAIQEPRATGGLSLLGGGSRTSTTAGTSSEEVALAGRGFNDKVEARYKSETGLDFGPVNRMENEFGQSLDAVGDFFAAAGLEFGEVAE